MSKRIFSIFLFLFVILFSSYFTYATDDYSTEVAEIIELFENDSSLYKNYFNNYIIYRNTSNNEIFVLLYNSTNTKFGINGSLFTEFYSYSDNNLYFQNGPKWYLGLYRFDIENNSLYSFLCTGERLDISQTSGYCVSHSLFDNMQILYTGSDIYTYSGSVSNGYNATLPFDFDNLDILLEKNVIEENNQEDSNNENNNEDNQEESSQINNEVIEEYFENSLELLEEINKGVFVLVFYVAVWVIIDFIRHAFFKERS